MKKAVSLKSTIRQPGKTILLFLLCAALSFGFLSQALQYAVVRRAVDESEAYYHAVGFLRPSDGEDADAAEAVSILQESPYVDDLNTYMPRAGFMPDVYNINIDGWNFDNMLYLRGTLKKIEVTRETVVNTVIDPDTMYAWSSDDTIMNRKLRQLTFDITEIFSGVPELATLGDMTFSVDVTDNPKFEQDMMQQLQIGESYFFCAVYGYYTRPSGKGMLSLFTLLPLGSVDGMSYIHYPMLRQTDSLADMTCGYPVAEGTPEDYFYPVAEDKQVNLSDAALAERNVEQALAYVHANERSLPVIPVKSMELMPYFENEYMMTEGRPLTLEDDETQNPVCVIRQEVADHRDLHVGDQLTITLRDAKYGQHVYTYVVPQDLQEEALPTATQTYTIVGIERNLTLQSWDGYPLKMRQEVFIPACFYPGNFDSYTTYANLSFVLRNVSDKRAFQEEYGSILADMGLQLEFMEDGWEAFHASSEAVLQPVKNSVRLMGLILLLGFLLVAFLYQRFRRRELAILRALGTSKSRTVWQAVMPLALLSLLGIGAGAAFAYDYGMQKAREAVAMLASAEESVILFTPLHMAALAAALWLVLLLMGFALLLAVSSKSVLPLLQGGRVKKD